MRERWARFIERVPPSVRHSLTSLLSLCTMVAGVILAVVWFFGFFPSWVGVLVWSRPDLPQDSVIAQIAMYSGIAYMFVGWAFFVAGACLVPVGWVLQLIALRFPAFHWASRAASVAALALFAIPTLLLVIELSASGLGLWWYGHP